MAKRSQIQLADINLSYLEWGRGADKQPLLLLHGMVDLALVWSSLGDALADIYHIIAPDLRGHGESDKPDTGYSCQDFIEKVKHLNCPNK